MPWYVKSGALYMRKDGWMTFAKSTAQAHEAKGGKLDPGFFWSQENAPSRINARTAAGQREAELTTKFALREREASA
jgi:hypothetical protein